MSKSANGIKYVFAVILLVLAMLLAYETWGIVKTVFSPEKNVDDLEDVADEVKDALKIVPVKNVTDVLEQCKLI